jgi:hypothetical protein
MMLHFVQSVSVEGYNSSGNIVIPVFFYWIQNCTTLFKITDHKTLSQVSYALSFARAHTHTVSLWSFLIFSLYLPLIIPLTPIMSSLILSFCEDFSNNTYSEWNFNFSLACYMPCRYLHPRNPSKFRAVCVRFSCDTIHRQRRNNISLPVSQALQFSNETEF